MTAKTATTAGPRQTKGDQNAVYTEYPVEAGEIIYEGGLVMIDADGYALPAADTAAQFVVGWADETVIATGLADGALNVRVVSNIACRMAASSITRAMINTNPLMYVIDDNTVDETQPGQSLKAGILVHPYISTAEGWVFIPAYGVRLYAL